MKKRLLAILLSLMMILSLLPVGVFAADAESIGTGEELAKLFTDVHAGESGSGNVTVTIDKDYDLTGYQWKSLTVQGYTGAGVVTVEGNNHKITGLNAPLFAGGFAGTSGIVVKNLTLTNVTINDSTSNQGIGAFINNVDSMPKIELDDCHLTDSKITSTGGARVGGLIGWTSGYNKKDDGPVDTYITVKNCSVENTEITAKGSVGGIIGHAGCNPATFHTFTNNTVTGCTLNSTDDGGWRVGVVVGTANVGEVTITGTKESNNNLTQTGRTAPEGQSNLYGRFVPNGTGKLVIDGVAVFNSDIVAAIGNTGYKTLADAYAALPRNVGTDSEPTTITVLKNSEGKAIGSDSDKGMNYVIDFGGHTYTVGKPAVGSTKTETQGLRVLKGSKAVFKNGTLKAANYSDMKMPVHTYGDVTFEDFTIDATEDQYAQIAYEVDNGTLNIKGNSNILAYNGQTGLYVAFWPRGGYTGGTTVNVDTTGKITGKMVYEWDDKADTAEQQTENKAVLNIKNGNFDITNIQTLFTSSLPSELKVPKIYISGGYFNVDPSAYCVTGKTGVKSDKEGYEYTVGTIEVKDENEIQTDTKAGTTTATLGDKIDETDKTAATTVGESVTPTKLTDTTPITETEKNEALTELVKNNKVTLESDGTIPENTTVTVVKETYLDVTVTGYDTESSTVSMNITPKYNLIAVAKNGNNAAEQIVLKSAQDAKVGSTEVKVTLPDAFKGKKVYINHNNGANLYVATADATTGEITFTTNGFSPFTFALTNPDVVAEVNGNAYKTLQAAVDAAKNGETVTVTGGATPYSATMSGSSRTITVENGTAAKIDVTINGTKETIAIGKTATFSYTAPVYTPITKKDVKFDDVDVNAYYAPAVKWAVENKITAGKTDKLFAPDDTCTRGEMITFLWNAAGKPAAKNTTNPFTDVNAGAFYYDAVLWAVSNGITSGTSDTTFSPDNTVSRAQVVAFLYNYANKPAAANSTFTDVAADAYYAPAVGWAAAQKITSGTGNNTFSPENDCTRAQIVTFLYNDLAK